MENRTRVTKQKVVLIAAVVTALSAGTSPASAHHDYPHMPLTCGDHYLIGISFFGGPPCGYDPHFGQYVIDTAEDRATPDPEPTTEPTAEPSTEPTKPGRGPKDRDR